MIPTFREQTIMGLAAPTAEIILFPIRQPSPSVPVASAAAVALPQEMVPHERLSQALERLNRALAEQRVAIAAWRGAVAELKTSAAQLADNLQRYRSNLGSLREGVATLHSQAMTLQNWGGEPTVALD